MVVNIYRLFSYVELIKRLADGGQQYTLKYINGVNKYIGGSMSKKIRKLN